VQVLVINTGSSSVKFSVIESTTETTVFSGAVDYTDSGPRQAVHQVLDRLSAGDPALPRGQVAAVGHRVVHGGDLYRSGVCITDEVKKGLKQLCELAPLHNPINLEGIEAAEAAWPNVPQVAVFDTAFHATLPPAARTYAVPWAWTEQWGLRRYGFHGLSHAYCTRRAGEMLGRGDLRLVICHLGAGCSVSAVRSGECIDTSMGFTPLAGLAMATRSGSIDPGLLIHAMRRHGLSADDLDRILNHESGLLGVSGVSGDMRPLLQAADAGNARARLAIDVFVHRLRQTIGAMAAVLGGVDCLVFTAGIGEHAAAIRRLACAGLGFLGLHLDPEANQRPPDADIATRESPGRILVLQTREDLTIVRETVRVLGT
jgi:acetate kinase